MVGQQLKKTFQLHRFTKSKNTAKSFGGTFLTHTVWRYLGPFRRGWRVWQTASRTVRQNSLIRRPLITSCSCNLSSIGVAGALIEFYNIILILRICLCLPDGCTMRLSVCGDICDRLLLWMSAETSHFPCISTDFEQLLSHYSILIFSTRTVYSRIYSSICIEKKLNFQHQ